MPDADEAANFGSGVPMSHPFFRVATACPYHRLVDLGSGSGGRCAGYTPAMAKTGSSAAAIPLPPHNLRMGGQHFQGDEAFVAAAVADVRKLIRLAGLGRSSRVLDWGCGAGRLAVGLKHEFGHVREYLGVDVQAPLIEWAAENLSDPHTRFSLVDVGNERYNPGGTVDHTIPAEPGVDIFYAYSVFSHMLPDDIAAYSRTIAGLLAPEGVGLVTAFVEPDVPSWSVNPAGYGPLTWEGPLHCVRFNQTVFEALLRQCGLRAAVVEHGTETDGQSLILLRRAAEYDL